MTKPPTNKAKMKTPGKAAKPKGRQGFAWLPWLLLGILVVVIYDVLNGPSGVLNLRELAQVNAGKRHVIDSLEHRREDLAQEKRRLTSDTAYLEAVVRHELGMAKPGEKVYRFLDKSPQP